MLIRYKAHKPSVRRVNFSKQRRKLTFNSPIALIGGGIGGTATALALQRSGFTSVRIFEKDPSFESRRQGYGLTIQQGVRALKTLGIHKEILEHDSPCATHYIFHSTGHILGYFGRTFYGVETGGNHRYNLHITRQDLRKALMDHLAPSTVVWGKQFQSYEMTKEGDVAVKFSDGTEHTCSFLIGADGIYSGVRKQKLASVSHNFPLRYLGIIVILGIAPCSHPLIKERKFQTRNESTRLYIMPFSNRNPNQAIMWQISFHLNEDDAKILSRDSSALKKEVLRRCADWHDPIPKVLSDTPTEFVTGTPVYDCDPMVYPWWEQNGEEARDDPSPRVVLLGDSAHPMSPLKGQGANQALLDAISLANFLAKSASGEIQISDAIPLFWKEMCPRSAVKVLAARNRVNILHSENLELHFTLPEKVCTPEILENLRKKNVVAQTAENIDDLVMQEIANVNPNFVIKKPTEKKCEPVHENENVDKTVEQSGEPKLSNKAKKKLKYKQIQEQKNAKLKQEGIFGKITSFFKNKMY